MKNKKLELLRSKLAMFALATSLSVTSLSGCSSNEILSSEEIESCIEDTSDFGYNAGLYKKQDGNWGIYYKKNNKYYDFKSYEYLNESYFHTILNPILISAGSEYSFWVGYIPFNQCNPNVTYTLNVINNLNETDIEKLKDDFFGKNYLRGRDIKLFHIEKIDGTNKQAIIGYPISDTEIFNIETWQLENYEGYAIIKESCEFKYKYVKLSEILDYLNEKKKNIVEMSTSEAEIINETETQVEETTEAETSLVEDEEHVGYEIESYSNNSYSIFIQDNFTSNDLTEVLDFLVNQRDNIKSLSIDANHNNTEMIEKLLKEVSKNDNIVILELCCFDNLNLSDIVTLSNLKWLTLMLSTMEDATQLNQFTQLERLYLSNAKDLNIISNLTQLQDLTISNRGKMELANIEVLKKFDHLHSLSLMDCNISDIEPLSDLSHLVYLNLEGNPIQNLSELTNMKSTPGVFITDKANLSDLKSCIEELTEKGIKIYCESNGKNDLITKEYLEQKDEAQLKLNK